VVANASANDTNGADSPADAPPEVIEESLLIVYFFDDIDVKKLILVYKPQ
jgi:hypothetical protein